MAVRVAINGFGRIGRSVYRAAHSLDADVEFVAINDIADPEMLATVLKHDSIHGRFPKKVEVKDDKLVVDGDAVKIMNVREEKDLPWADLDVDVLVESTGKKRPRKELEKHLHAGAKKILSTVPSEEPADATVVYGVNHHDLAGDEQIILNASGTTNSSAILCKVIHEHFGIEYGYLTTIHAYTLDQSLLDYPHEDMRRARSAALSIIPTTTHAGYTIERVLPELEGKIDAMSYRVPVSDGSIVDLSLQLRNEATIHDINVAMKTASESNLKGLLHYTNEPLVSVDIKGSTYSAIYDAQLTRVLRPNFIKVSAWYDNETGYSHRVVDLIEKLG
ncbi:MAG: type I glyceraldehyde-3-phosphate dehydrogenase [Candidatus Marinimicrobia bacterium]|nr:type I glyceraldehyde-3-phosphate dehydrogenase [Candidatus Neomarinimicrobiota bacterium]MCF7829094.1 type I glyceraldehyde-3-phosphate dehydrogenase [Candidatus Neomarinimicrobiota bacterium]MCF7881507.1 type I glyceraldehyde-3-phosphate dehydrogenase [Candidatus Neomarinimicrobiota bacterium]